MKDTEGFEQERKRMVEEQLVRRGIRDPKILDAFRAVPRHEFVPPESNHLAYLDGPLPIGEGQTISQPYIVGLMTELLRLEGNEKVLEIGTGSGYQAAILGELAQEVYTVERFESLARTAEMVLKDLGYTNIQVVVSDGSQGLPAAAPYDGILVAAAAPEVPPPLLEQLADGGRLVIPVGGSAGQILERWERRRDSLSKDKLIPVAFVPLRGSEGWRDQEWRR